MRNVGHRQERPISFSASAVLLAEGARFNDDIHRLPTGNATFIPKGIFRFKTHEDANRHQLDCLVEGMTQAALARRWWNSTGDQPRWQTSRSWFRH